jgi:hypothetical protein
MKFKKLPIKNDRTYIGIAAVIGFTGIFTAMIKPGIGLAMVIVAGVVIFIGYRASRSRLAKNVQRIPSIKTVSSAFAMDPNINPVAEPLAPVTKVVSAAKPERPLGNKLVANLRIIGVDVGLPVFYGVNDREVSIREMVIEVGTVATSLGMSDDKVIERISTIYEYFWVYVDEVCTKYGPNGEAAIKSALATKCLVVSFPEQAVG